LLDAKLDFAAIDTPDRNGFEVYAFQTPYVHGPTVKGQYPFFQFLRRWIAWASERENAARWAKIVHCSSRAPLITDQFFPGDQQSQAFSRNTMNQRASSATDGAVAHSNMINLGIDFEFDLSAMATSAVCFHGASYAPT